MAAGNALDQLEASIQELRVDFERFFNGALLVPPISLREQVARRLKRLREKANPSYAEHFRLLQLEARFNAYTEQQNRRLREREEGRVLVGPPPAEVPRYDPNEGVVVSRSLDPEAVEALYAGLVKRGQVSRFDLETFRGYLQRQVEEIGSKTGCSEVRFRLVEDGGQVKLKARPVRAESTSS